MTPPTFFTVRYVINPWMDTAIPVDTATAVAQWAVLRDTYRRLGHAVDEIAPVPGLPDMVYAANAALIVDDTAVIARFRHHQRAGESWAYTRWLRAHGYTTVSTVHVQEGQGDLMLVGSMVLAGIGFRTAPQAPAEIAKLVGLPVVGLELTDPRFYHLDTALAVLDDTTIAYYPAAFTAEARATLTELFPDAIVVAGSDAHVLGLNAVSDGRHVIHPAAATGFADQLHRAGFVPIGLDLSELLKGGGAAKCCTLEVYP
ncbi:arginine deiminase family protein [Mycolicibacter sp. MYC340]|uniref:Arginine deiminase family protein n=2 Tax=[Mycobacterium] nativiensis TaxID=2855503 RepID=A0ABU5XVE4_9MYCO|nr:dimethylargininase [Mycolicibacter sp. MYC340]MEB3031959.1 arginine deiminase family protein [Mycolicibacter sp. MYC340]